MVYDDRVMMAFHTKFAELKLGRVDSFNRECGKLESMSPNERNGAIRSRKPSVSIVNIADIATSIRGPIRTLTENFGQI